jgi:hypothetical protein
MHNSGSITEITPSRNRYLTEGRTHEPRAYFEMPVSVRRRVRCSCPRSPKLWAVKHANALSSKLEKLAQAAGLPTMS